MGEDFEEEAFPEYETHFIHEDPDKAAVKLEVGDWVMIRNDFDKIRFSGDPGVNTRMLEEKGKITQIRSVPVIGKLYKLVGDQWSWHARWLEPYDTSKDINIDESDIMALLE